MAEPRTCPECGAELAADVPEGLCPRCLLEQGIGSQPPGPFPEKPAETLPHSPASAGFVAPSPELLAPHFPQLEILGLLGQGGMGAVYKAQQKSLDRLVAVNILPRESAADPSFADRFSREAKALARLSHPQIVSIYDFGETAGLFYFVMEFVDGVNLREMLRGGELTSHEALAIVPQICEALQYAHDEGFVHRDIKPENILLDKRGRVKIADFGLAKLLGTSAANFKLTGTQQVMGTPQYMAPEQIETPHEVDHRADIYSLGVVFYEMLTGELPIGRFERPSHRVQVDVRLDDIVLKTLEKRPERRYQHASEVKTEVDSIVDASTPKARAAVPPDDERQRSEELAESPPAWIYVGVTAAFTLSWIIVGAGWNFGPLGINIGIGVMAAVTYGVGRRFITHSPKLRAELARQSFLGRGFRLAGGLTAFAVSMWIIVVLHVNAWEWFSEIERVDWLHSVPTNLHGAAAREAFPIGQLEALRQKPGEAIACSVSHIRGAGRFASPAGDIVFLTFALLALGGPGFISLAVSIAFDTRRYRNSWKYGQGFSLGVTMLCVGAFIIVHFARLVAEGAAVTYIPDQETRAAVTTKQLDDRLNAWADTHGLEFVGRYWNYEQIVPSPDGDQRTKFSVRMFELRPVSMWSLWRVTWGLVLQPLPPLKITSVSLDDTPGAYLSINSGMCSDGTGEKEMWMATIQSLQRAVTSGESD